MISYVIRRLIAGLIVMLGVVTIVFVIVRLIPGDPCTAALGEHATQARCAIFNARIGLDEPVWVQYGIYLQDLSQFDLGQSIRYGRPVTAILVERLPTTIELTVYALIIAILVGIPLGIISAYRRNSPADVGTMIIANLGVSIPVFVLGLVLAYVFAVILRDTFLTLPPSGRLSAGFRFQSIPQAWGLTDLTGPLRGILDFFSNMYTVNGLVTGQFNLFIDALRHLILPAVALATIPMAIIARMTRSSLLEVLGREYIRTARAKGLGGFRILRRHGLRNALLPVVTVIGLSVAGLLSGAVLTETIFGLTGIGLTVFESLTVRDYTVVQGMALLVAVFYVLVNLIVDVSYGFLDPRVRVS